MIKVKQSILAVIIAGSIGLQSCAPNKQDKAALKLSEAFVTEQLNDASKQIKYLESQIQESDIPTTFKDGKHVNWCTAWWRSGSYPGTALYPYAATGAPELFDIAMRI